MRGVLLLLLTLCVYASTTELPAAKRFNVISADPGVTPVQKVKEIVVETDAKVGDHNMRHEEVDSSNFGATYSVDVVEITGTTQGKTDEAMKMDQIVRSSDVEHDTCIKQDFFETTQDLAQSSEPPRSIVGTAHGLQKSSSNGPNKALVMCALFVAANAALELVITWCDKRNSFTLTIHHKRINEIQGTFISVIVYKGINYGDALTTACEAFEIPEENMFFERNGVPMMEEDEVEPAETGVSLQLFRREPYVLDAENVENHPPVGGMDKNLYFWSHSKPEETPDGISWTNKHEAVMAVKLVQHLLKQNYTPQDIVVLTTYTAQRPYFYREYPMTFGQIDTSLIPVETVDSFQRRGRKIVIVSLVRAHRGVQVNFGIGFLAVANRICVALTRAQHGMYGIGNGAYDKNNAALWIVDTLNAHHMIQYFIPSKCVARGNVISIREPSDFAQLSPEEGCLEQCNIEKKCGHICERRCHPKVEFEHALRCEMPYQLRCMNPQYKHPCGRMCFEDCGPCLRLECIQLQCGHTISVPCSRIPVAQCDQKCSKVLPCGHPCPLRCGVIISRQDCEQLVTLKLPDCSHSKLVKCCSLFTGEKLNLECEEQCENNMLTCEHRCQELCGRPCTIECMEIVTVQLPCGHGQEVQCSKYMPNRLDAIKCQSLIPKTLIPCGHKEKVSCGQEPSTDLCSVRCPKIIKETCVEIVVETVTSLNNTRANKSASNSPVVITSTPPSVLRHAHHARHTVRLPALTLDVEYLDHRPMAANAVLFM